MPDMSVLQRLPKSITPCPIEEAVLEIRFSSQFPSDAIFGIIYNRIKNYFKGIAPVGLPILQIPEAVRASDPNLLYQAHYRIFKDNLGMTIGPRSLIFSNLRPYESWKTWKEFFTPIIFDIRDTGIVNEIERIGLRYINILEDNVLSNINLNLQIASKNIIKESSTIRTELVEDGFIKILQVGNMVSIQTPSQLVTSSLIDIDCVKNLGIDSDTFYKEFNELIENAHNLGKKLFYSLLKPEYLSSFSPIYEE